MCHITRIIPKMTATAIMMTMMIMMTVPIITVTAAIRIKRGFAAYIYI